MDSFPGLLNNAALMLILCVIYDTFGVYAISNRQLKYWLTGFLVGLIAIVVMLNPWSLQEGVFFDTRWVLLSLSGLFFGFIPTAVAVVIAGAFRLFQGGPGAIVGTIVMVVTAGVGIGCRYWQKKYKRSLGWQELFLFGVLVQLSMLACMLFMPADLRFSIIKAVALPTLIVYPVLILIVGLILQRQKIRRETDRQLAEHRKALSRERGLLREVINSIPDLIYYKTTEGKYLGCNKSFESFTGEVEEKMIGKTAADFFEKDMARSIELKDTEIFISGGRVNYEEWVDCRDGRKVFHHTIKTPFRGTDGTLYGLVGISRDMTERELGINKLAAERERLVVTLRSIGDGVITTDVQGSVVMINTVAEKLTGWTQDEARGKPLADIFHIINEESREICENPVGKVLASGEIVELANHTALIAKDGTERSIADSGAPIFDKVNKIIGVVLVFRDVTNQIKIENELLKVEKLESIGLLAGGIAHDFNNILAAILGNINLALLDPTVKDETKAILGEAEKASVRAKNLTQQLLTFAKGGKPIKEVTVLDGVIRDSAEFVLHGDRVACRYDIPSDLWLVEIDKGQIGQVVQNLVLNASHAMPEEGGELTISCKNISSLDQILKSKVGRIPNHVPEGKFVEIVVQDKGTGISADIVEKIFDPYFSTKKEGSGLGLTITHSIINSHNGYIFIDSTPGIGTAVSIYLPASTKRIEDSPDVEEISEMPSSLKILVMDDDEMVQDVTRTMLMRLGHEVELAENGEKAIELYQKALLNQRKHDLLIMDLTIPGGMGGKEAVKKILNVDPDARVVVSSGYSNDPIMSRYNEYGFCAAIVKPFKLQDLSRVLSQAVGRVLA